MLIAILPRRGTRQAQRVAHHRAGRVANSLAPGSGASRWASGVPTARGEAAIGGGRCARRVRRFPMLPRAGNGGQRRGQRRDRLKSHENRALLAESVSAPNQQPTVQQPTVCPSHFVTVCDTGRLPSRLFSSTLDGARASRPAVAAIATALQRHFAVTRSRSAHCYSLLL